MFRNQPALLKTTSSLAWSWRRWTERTPTWFVPPQWERSEVRRSSSCSTAGEAPSTTGAPSTPETSSPSAGVPWQNTAYSHLETSVSAAFIIHFSSCFVQNVQSGHCEFQIFATVSRLKNIRWTCKYTQEWSGCINLHLNKGKKGFSSQHNSIFCQDFIFRPIFIAFVCS